MVEQVSFAADIRPLFTDIDIDHMSWFCDLSAYADVKANAAEIFDRLNGVGGRVMPPPPAKAWPTEKIDLFKAWMDGGYAP
jgi:hypothetical protein